MQVKSASRVFSIFGVCVCLRRIIPTDCLETCIHAYVSSHIDFCNILLNDHADQLQNLFQSVQRLLQGPAGMTLPVNKLQLCIGCLSSSGIGTKHCFSAILIGIPQLISLMFVSNKQNTALYLLAHCLNHHINRD